MKLTPDEHRELEHWVRSWSPCMAVGDMIRCSMGRIAIKNLGSIRMKMSGGSIPLSGVLPDDDVAMHIVDWLTADFMDSADWIDRVDDKGRPLKLMKCGSYEQLTHEADKAMRRRLLGKVAPLGEEDESLVAELAEGYRVVKLLTPRALDAESSAMQHCVGQGSYDWYVKQGVIEILSLRDPAGHPHVTMEVSDDGRMIRQLKGKQNRHPVRRYMDLLKPYGRAAWKNADRYWQVVKDVDGNTYDADKIPAGTAFESLSGVEVASLPARLTVRGNLNLPPLRDGERVPEDLQVDGRILCESDPERFPEHLRKKVWNPWKAFLRDAFADFTDAAGRFVRGMAEVRRVGDEIDLDFPAARRQLYIDPRREPEQANISNGSRLLLGNGLPRLPETPDERGREDGWRNPRDRRWHAVRRYPQAPDYAEFMRSVPQPQEPPVQVSVVPEAEGRMLEPGTPPVAADFYPRRRRRAITGQRVTFDEFRETLIRDVAAGVGLSYEEAIEDAPRLSL
jgi:hypothetical protein